MNRSGSIGKLLMEWYGALRERFGHRNWWPAGSPFEVCVGAVLTQNTAWKNVVKAIANLKAEPALDPLRLYEMDLMQLAELIRPCGYYNVKAARLKNLVSHLVEKHGGDLDALFLPPTAALREELLSINGVGKETADSIILYAAYKPIFVVDAYTKWVLERHGLMPERNDYDSIQAFFHANLECTVELFNDFHAQFVAVGHAFCRKTPKCDQCPLERFREREAEIWRAGGSS
ncbi:MAG: endonuclease III domain-containing protein [Desulfomonile tiedjei]|nr:endonuclease III domain-containing protein [Desulfomonile tiedjei]